MTLQPFLITGPLYLLFINFAVHLREEKSLLSPYAFKRGLLPHGLCEIKVNPGYLTTCSANAPDCCASSPPLFSSTSPQSYIYLGHHLFTLPPVDRYVLNSLVV